MTTYGKALRRLDVFLYGAIAAALIVGLFTGYNLNGQHFRIVKVDHPVKVTLAGYVSVKQALGAPDKEVPGEQINAGLKGATCGIWNAKKLVVCGA